MLGREQKYGKEGRYAKDVVFVCMRWLRSAEMEMDRRMELVRPIQRPEGMNSYNIADAANQDRVGMSACSVSSSVS